MNQPVMNKSSMNYLVIGLGGTGGKSTRPPCKLIFSEQKHTAQSDPSVVSLNFKFSREMMSQADPTRKVPGKSVQLPAASQLQITEKDLLSLLNDISKYPGIQSWIGSQAVWKEILGTIVGKALGGQKRRLGRFLFARRINEFKTKVKILVQGLQSNGDARIAFHVIAGLACCRRSGSIVDVLSQPRNAYTDTLTYRKISYLLLPGQYPLTNWGTGIYRANGFATLAEISAISTGSCKPVDVPTGNKINGRDKFNGTYAFAKDNENGHIAKVDAEVSGIIVKFVFQKIFIADLIGLTSIARIENAENGDARPVTAAASKSGERSKRFLGFGIKRIFILEEKIKEYLSLSFAQQTIRQLRFNNCQQAIEFADESKNFDAIAVVRTEDVLAKWKLFNVYLLFAKCKLCDDYLLPAEIMLISDDLKRSWKYLVDEWASVSPAFKQLAHQQEPKTGITYLSSFYQNHFDESFRNLSLKEFCQIKELSKVEMAKDIRRLIEQVLLEQWENASRSPRENSKITDALLVWLQEKLKQIDVRAAKTIVHLDELRNQAAGNLNDWTSLWALCKTFGKQDNIFERQSILLQSLFVKFTKIEALGVVKSLPSRVIWEIGDCRILIGFLILSKHYATYRISKDLDERLAIGGVADSSCHAIRFYEPTGVKSAIKNLVANENVQTTHASEICLMMIAKLEEKLSIARFFKRLSVVDLVDNTISASEGSALAAHSNMIAESNRRILDISILSNLAERRGSDRAALRLKIHELVNQAGVFLTINPLECGNAAPGISVSFHVLVAKTIALLPKAADKEGFVKVLQDDFCASMSGDIEFIDTENQRINRTILTIKNLFPVRMVGIPPRLREMCNERLNGSRERMEMEIFTSCSLANYASLYAQSGADLSKLAGVQRFLGLALGLIVKSPPGGLLVFNSNNSDRFDNPPVELGSFILNAMDRMDFAAVEAIISANQIALKTGCIGGFVESKIKSEVEKSKSEDGNAPDSLEYQQHIERARYSLMLNREVTS